MAPPKSNIKQREKMPTVSYGNQYNALRAQLCSKGCYGAIPCSKQQSSLAPKRNRLGFPDKPEVVSRSFLVCTDSLDHTGSLLYYDFGSYDQPFPRYSAKRVIMPKLWQPYRKTMATLTPSDRPTLTYGGSV